MMVPNTVWARLAAVSVTLGGFVSLSGCGGSNSMASSSFGWQLSAVQAFGNANVQIKRTGGAATTGEFTIVSSTPVLEAGVPIFLEAEYFAVARNVNAEVFSQGTVGTDGIPVATYSAVWSAVTPSTGVLFNNQVGTTFTDYSPSNATNVLLTGRSGTFITVSQSGTYALKLTVRLQFADGSSQTREYPVTVTVP